MLFDEVDIEIDQETKDENIEKNEELEVITKDPVRKFQFIYNESLCMTGKYPEIETSSNMRNIEVAPGEGQIPRDIMSGRTGISNPFLTSTTQMEVMEKISKGKFD